MAIDFSIIFIVFLVINTCLKLWLDKREIASILRHRSAVPEAFAQKITLQAHQKAADYSIETIRFSQKERWVSLLFLLIATFGGLIQQIYDFFTAWLGNGIWTQISIVGVFALISSLVDLPFSWISQFKIEEKYGFNTMKKSQFFKDLGISTLLSIALGLPLLAVIFWLWQVAGSLWWLWAWTFYVAFNFVVLWIYPNFIAPLFNKFENLPEGDLYNKINFLLQKVDFESNGLYVMDASKRNAKGNAYMTGFGKNKRIVFFDTLIKKLTPDEIEAVLAHELGHYKLKHIYKMMAVSFVFAFVVFALLDFASEADWFYKGLGVVLNDGTSHGVALILFSLVLPVFTFPFTPLASLSSRKHEFEADKFAVENANGRSLITALVKLFSDNASTLTPDPVYSAFYSSHPDASTRINAIEKILRNEQQ